MKSDKIAALLAQFEAIVHQEQGVDYWLARELQELLGYLQWRNFEVALQKAKEACEKAGQRVSDHFAGVSKMVLLGSGAERSIDDVALTRYACYLIAQNGDPRKEARPTLRYRPDGRRSSKSVSSRTNGCGRGSASSRARRSFRV